MKHEEVEKRLGKKVEKNKRYAEILTQGEQDVIGFWTWVENRAIEQETKRLREDDKQKPLSDKAFAELVESIGQEILTKHGGDVSAACAAIG